MESKVCPRCKTEKTIDLFYTRRDGANTSSYCKVCTTNQTVERQHALKEKCVNYKGGKCLHCGYNKCINALEFHHVDPSTKDFSLARYKRYVFNDIVKKELDQCILLCSNCHREEHFRLFNS